MPTGGWVDSLQGRYITAEDVGTTVEDMVVVSAQTRWVTGLPLEAGGSGDPSPMTARGVVAAMRAAAAHLWGSDDLSGRRAAIQGVGKVGRALAELLAAAGCDLVVADVDDEAVAPVRSATGAELVDVDDILGVDWDLLAPCALGGVLSAWTIPSLRCAAVVGSANNQLGKEADADRLAEAGVLYVPDFLANAGGVINISVELEPGGYREAEALARVEGIFDQVGAVLKTATRDGSTPLRTALQMAGERIARG